MQYFRGYKCDLPCAQASFDEACTHITCVAHIKALFIRFKLMF